MDKIRWIRLDIPYQKDGKKMRAVAGHSEDKGGLSTFVTDYSDSIPNILTLVKDYVKENNLECNDSTVLVYPLDGRLGLAHVVLEFAQKENWAFDRHIPPLFYPGVEVLCSFEQNDTGSAEDTLPSKEAQQLIFKLNNDAQSEYQRSDLPAAMSCLRQALQLAVKHFGWSSPGVAYSLTNLGHVMRGTGNNDNMLEVSATINRMLNHWDKEMPDREEWVGAGSILEQLIGVCNSLGKSGYADRLTDYKVKLS